MAQLDPLLKALVDRNAQELVLSDGQRPAFRYGQELRSVSQTALNRAQIAALITELSAEIDASGPGAEGRPASCTAWTGTSPSTARWWMTGSGLRARLWPRKPKRRLRRRRLSLRRSRRSRPPSARRRTLLLRTGPKEIIATCARWSKWAQATSTSRRRRHRWCAFTVKWPAFPMPRRWARTIPAIARGDHAGAEPRDLPRDAATRTSPTRFEGWPASASTYSPTARAPAACFASSRRRS